MSDASTLAAAGRGYAAPHGRATRRRPAARRWRDARPPAKLPAPRHHRCHDRLSKGGDPVKILRLLRPTTTAPRGTRGPPPIQRDGRLPAINVIGLFRSLAPGSAAAALLALSPISSTWPASARSTSARPWGFRRRRFRRRGSARSSAAVCARRDRRRADEKFWFWRQFAPRIGNASAQVAWAVDRPHPAEAVQTTPSIWSPSAPRRATPCSRRFARRCHAAAPPPLPEPTRSPPMLGALVEAIGAARLIQATSSSSRRRTWP